MNNEEFESSKKSREITKVILDYGVSQKDIENIIRNLSLELEDINLTKKLNNCFNKEEDNVKIKLNIEI